MTLAVTSLLFEQKKEKKKEEKSPMKIVSEMSNNIFSSSVSIRCERKMAVAVR